MGAAASVIQEYYKAVDYWADIVGNRDWKLSVWIVGQNDVDLVDRFLEIERSPVGQFDDIFFRFDTPYRGDDEEYTEQLWQEYAGWFSEKVEEKYDILRALRHDGLLKEEYIPDVSVEHTAGNLWREMLRFKACISRLDDALDVYKRQVIDSLPIVNVIVLSPFSFFIQSSISCSEQFIL